jgi:small subunit ribosomal protein S6
MALYEHIFLARQDVSGQQVDALIETFKGIIEEHGGSVTKVENWGLKTLPYRVKKNRKAHYALMNIDAGNEAMREMDRQMRLNEDILRHMTIRVEKHEEGPSAPLRKSDRDDRRGGRFGGRDKGSRPPRTEGGRDRAASAE